MMKLNRFPSLAADAAGSVRQKQHSAATSCGISTLVFLSFINRYLGSPFWDRRRNPQGIVLAGGHSSRLLAGAAPAGHIFPRFLTLSRNSFPFHAAAQAELTPEKCPTQAKGPLERATPPVVRDIVSPR